MPPLILFNELENKSSLNGMQTSGISTTATIPTSSATAISTIGNSLLDEISPLAPRTISIGGISEDQNHQQQQYQHHSYYYNQNTPSAMIGNSGNGGIATTTTTATITPTSSSSTGQDDTNQPTLWTALYDYHAQGEDELSLRRGQIVYVLSMDSNISGDEGWWTGKIGDKV